VLSVASARFFLGGSAKSIKHIAHAARLPSRRMKGNSDFSQLFSHSSSSSDVTTPRLLLRREPVFPFTVLPELSTGAKDPEALLWRRKIAKRGRLFVECELAEEVLLAMVGDELGPAPPVDDSNTAMVDTD